MVDVWRVLHSAVSIGTLRASRDTAGKNLGVSVSPNSGTRIDSVRQTKNLFIQENFRYLISRTHTITADNRYRRTNALMSVCVLGVFLV